MLLSLENIVKEYGNRIVLDNVNLRVHQGERLALVGSNGSGKTTIMKIVMGLESADRGKVIIAKRTKIGYLSQDLRELECGDTFGKTAMDYEKVAKIELKLRELEKQMADPALQADPGAAEQVMNKYSRLVERYERLDGYSIEAKIKAILLGLGLRKEALTLPLTQLSGGEKMRVALARILLEEPDLLMLDEPTNHLDIQATEWLEGFLQRFGGGVLLVSHDRYFLDQVTTRVAEIENGTIATKSGTYSMYMEQKALQVDFINKERKRLQREILEATKLTQQLKSMRRISAAKSRAKTVERLRSELTGRVGEVALKEHLHQVSGPKIAFTQAKHVSAEVARADKLSKRYGKVVLFSEASFFIRGGERVGIIGPNGCGKTTLLNILLGKDDEYEGFARLGPWVKYGFVGQRIVFDDPNRTIKEELLSKKEMKDSEARDYLSQFQFYGEEVDKRIEVLSGGEKVRLLLACIMLDKPDCLIMDEPTNHLDMPARDALESALLEFHGTVIAVSHDRYFLNRCVERILEIADGKTNSYLGNYDAYKCEKLAKQTQESVADQPAHSRNRVKEQQEKKAPCDTERKDAIMAIEARIMCLEEELENLKTSISADQDVDYEVYEEYGKLAAEIEQLYKIWESLL
jgi:ATP-binding cassette subfamily F protein 3